MGLLILVLTVLFMVYINFKLTKEIEILKKYKMDYFREQEQSEAYRSCLYIALTDMLDNDWYETYSQAFKSSFDRIEDYKFKNQFDVTMLIARMLFAQKSVKFSYDYEEYLISKGE